MGPSVVTCQEDTGCWTPRLLPVCRRLHQYRDEPLRGDTSILDIHTILVATTGSVIGILLIVLALIRECVCVCVCVLDLQLIITLTEI
ncbi:hypothetical protein E2C01_061033 [Portunus trituberculatus]|uniref:Sushi domain-containing protein n=1 Tax=Portunus trituberculatus TaxID=210409 RepID=A0A5B7HC46_PORTR|nr:hypothetical protein [Portunus trituberculatus]